MTAAREAISTNLRRIVALLVQANESVGQFRESLREHFAHIQTGFEAHRMLYDAAASENEVIQERLESLRSLGGRISNLEETRGTIDTTEVREVIAQVMEGGAEAFHLRRAKYGF